MARPAEEMLYVFAIRDYWVDTIVGKGPGATAIPLDLAPFTLVGATTRAGTLPCSVLRGPVRVHRPLRLLVLTLTGRQSARRRACCESRRPRRRGQIASRSRGMPQVGNRLLRRVRDYAQVHGHDEGRSTDRQRGPGHLRGSTRLGLSDRLDRAVLGALLRIFLRGTAGTGDPGCVCGGGGRDKKKGRILVRRRTAVSDPAGTHGNRGRSATPERPSEVAWGGTRRAGQSNQLGLGFEEPG